MKKTRYNNLSFLCMLTAGIALGFMLLSCGSEQKQGHQASAQSVQNEEQQTTNAVADPMQNKGIGPVDHVDLSSLDEAMAAEGKAFFESNCTACHKLEERYIGPALKEVTARRSPEWIMNMIMNPNEMVEKDPIAKALLAEYLAPMANQSVSQEDARKLLEYFRSVDEVK